jgi:hypothetical protein
MEPLKNMFLRHQTYIACLNGTFICYYWCFYLAYTPTKLDLLGVQEVRWKSGGTELAGEYTFFYGKGNEIHELGTGFIYA